MGTMVIVLVALDTAPCIVVLFPVAKQLQIVLLSSRADSTMHNFNYPTSFMEPIVKHLLRRIKGDTTKTKALLLSCYHLKWNTVLFRCLSFKTVVLQQWPTNHDNYVQLCKTGPHFQKHTQCILLLTHANQRASLFLNPQGLTLVRQIMIKN